MEGLIIGLDLCDSYARISCAEKEESFTFPAIICKKKEEDEWYVGEEAYLCALEGEGIIVDQLLQLVKKDGSETISGIRYEGITLLNKFLEKILAVAKESLREEWIDHLVITLPTIHGKVMDGLMFCCDYLGIPRDKVHVISHGESFIYYVLSQEKEIWNNQIGLFDLNEESMCYYEMKIQRGLGETTVVAEREKLEESFDLDRLKTASGKKLADKILCSCGDRLLKKKMFSSIFLTGKGFETHEWAADFMKMICSRRRVFIEPAIFSKGASYKAADCLREKTSYPYLFICDGRLDATVSVKVMHRDQENELVLVSAGDNWYESRVSVDFILDNQNHIEFLIQPMDRKKNYVKITLEDFPERLDKTMKVQVSIGFLDENTMAVAVKDKGFGELFPATDAVLRQEVML